MTWDVTHNRGFHFSSSTGGGPKRPRTKSRTAAARANGENGDLRTDGENINRRVFGIIIVIRKAALNLPPYVLAISSELRAAR
jgi:hypothetical protein